MGSGSTGIHRMHQPVVFDEFFEMGLHETFSPFITRSSRKWGTNLLLKASLLAAVLLIVSFGLTFVPGYQPLSSLLLVGVYFFAGTQALIDSVDDLSNLQINIDVLMTLAAFSSVLIGSGYEGALLLVLFAISGAIEDAVTARAKGAISSLRKLSPTKAVVVQEDGTLIDRAVSDVIVGTHILVKSGEVVPLDGRIIKGSSSVNLVHLTGENLPVSKTVNDEVPAGARNLEGAITLEVLRTSADSTLAKIVELVTQAQEARPKLQRWFDKVSERYALSIITLSATFALTFPLAFGMPLLGVEGSLYRALAFLIAASPCALILAIPIAYLSAVSVCARTGILLKGGITLDALASCRIIAFDKTGTLTTGVLTCLGMEVVSGDDTPESRRTAIAVASAMEQNAVHPIAKAIIAYAAEEKVMPMDLDKYLSVPGYGLEASFQHNGQPTQAYIGRLEYLAPYLPPEIVSAVKEKIRQRKEFGELLAVLLIDSTVFLFRFSDTIRPRMRETIAELKRSGKWRLLMLTGDHMVSARKIANELGLDEFHAELLPEHKLQYVTKLSNSIGLAMVGDGVNDAPALARATVGICMGKVGSATAIDASDVVLLHDDLTLLNWLMNKADQTQHIVKQNLALATIAIIVASSSALLGIIPLWAAVVMHEGGTVLVGLNALRLLRSARP